MNIIAHLQFGDNVTGIYNKEYLVVRYHTRIARSHNSYHPDSLPRCDSVEVTVIAPGKEDLELHEWYFSNEYRTGRIVFELMELGTSGDNEDSSRVFPTVSSTRHRKADTHSSKSANPTSANIPNYPKKKEE